MPDDVRILQLPGRPTVGAKRNAGCVAARGEVIAHWDDDDYSAPGRLADQIERLVSTGKAVTGYRAMRFTDGTHWWEYRSPPEFLLGTSLCYRRDWWVKHPFTSEQIGEDNSFVSVARAHGAIESADAGDLMFATNHSGNTSPRVTRGSNWHEIEPWVL